MRKFFYSLLALFCVCIAAILAHKAVNLYRNALLLAEREWALQALFEKDVEALDAMERGAEAFFDALSARAGAAKISGGAGLMAQDPRGFLEGYKNEILAGSGVGLAEIYAKFFAALKANKDGFAAVFSETFSAPGHVSENAMTICANSDFCLEYFCDENSFEKAAEAAARAFAKSLNSDLEKWGAIFGANPRGEKFSDFVSCKSAKAVAAPDFPEFCAAAESAMPAALEKAKKAFLEFARGSAKPNMDRLHERDYLGAFLVYFK